jgi:hypothetical protein
MRWAQIKPYLLLEQAHHMKFGGIVAIDLTRTLEHSLGMTPHR